jgi:hypothetical protein
MRPAATFAISVLASVAAPRFAAASSVALDWVAPDGCPSSAAVSDAIDRSVRESPSAVRVRARVVVTQEGGAFLANIDLGAPGSLQTRRLEADSCSALADAVVLVVTLAADSDVAPPALETPLHDPPPARPVSVREAPRRTPSATAAPPAYWAASASFALDTAILPSAAPGGDVALGYGWSRASVEIDGAFLAPQSATLPARSSQGARMWLAGAGARACYDAMAAQIDVGPCAGASVVWIVASGFGGPPDQPSDATATVLVATLGARARLRVAQRLALRLTAEAVIPSQHPTFVIEDGGGEVFHVPTVSFRGSLGAEVRF